MPPPPYNSKDFRHFQLGFTLAEMLITLAIIGIIAALTVPTLMSKHQDHAFRVAMKKKYAEIANAVAMMNANGEPFYHDTPNNETTTTSIYYTNPETFKNYFKLKEPPHVICEEGLLQWGGNKISKMYQAAKTDTKHRLDNDSNTWVMIVIGLSATLTLSDGSIVQFNQDAYSHDKNVIFDVNGVKGPNKIGKDMYRIPVTKQADNSYKLQLINVPAEGCCMNKSGWNCSYEYMKDINYKIPDEC